MGSSWPETGLIEDRAIADHSQPSLVNVSSSLFLTRLTRLYCNWDEGKQAKDQQHDQVHHPAIGRNLLGRHY